MVAIIVACNSWCAVKKHIKRRRPNSINTQAEYPDSSGKIALHVCVMRAHMCAMCRQQSDARDRRDYLRFCWRGGGSETRQFHYQHHRAANQRVALMRIECCTESSCMKNCARVRFGPKRLRASSVSYLANF